MQAGVVKGLKIMTFESRIEETGRLGLERKDRKDIAWFQKKEMVISDWEKINTVSSTAENVRKWRVS